MRKVKIWLVLSLVVGVAAVFAESQVDESKFVIRKIDEQVVLYTIQRGSYDKAGMAIGKLFALAGQKGLQPCGSVSYVYLNNPQCVSSEHWLTEIRIPVSKEALKYAGTLGEMTDVKILPSMEVAVAIKPEGQADQSDIYNRIYIWIIKQNYMVLDSACETFLTNSMSGNYAQMKSQIAIPVKKLCDSKN